MMISTSPEGNEVVQTPWEVVATVSINGLEKTGGNPNIHGKNVEVAGSQTVENRNSDSSKTKDHGFDWRGIFSSKSEWCRVLVVNLVDAFVEWTPVH
jgi:hypothetical protein